MAFPNDSVVTESACNAGDSGDLGSITGWEDPGGQMATHSKVFLPGEFLPWTEGTGGL